MARPRFQAPVDLGSVHKIFAKCKGFEKLGSLRPSRPLYPRGNFVTLLAKILGRGYFLRFWRLLWEYQKNESFGLCKFSLLGNRKKIHPIHSHMYLKPPPPCYKSHDITCSILLFSHVFRNHNFEPVSHNHSNDTHSESKLP